jgi:hypothetical protein
MKLADRTVEVHSAGINASNQFTIAQTSKMFKILSDSLYSDKVMAVIRELSTNAFDSHISAGNKNPFLVKLPTASDPNFTVRDYGTGLSQSDMESLYTTYGASNKNDSNDFVGCLGLGSKSPFAYTKSFSTTSYFNGKQYTYIAAIDDSGVPTLNLIHSCDTDEPNGLSISFAVKQQDFREFSQKAIRIFHYFKIKPIIQGGVDWDFSKDYGNRNIVIDGDGWRVCRLNTGGLFPNTYHRIGSGIIALMGNIAYPVQVEHLIGEEKADTPDHIAKWNRAFNKADIASWKSFVSEIIDQNLYLELDFGIGELEMDVSREGLQYTKSVIKALREKTQDIFLELKENFSQKIASAKTKVEAIITYYQMNDLAGGWGVGASWTDSSGTVHSINSGSDLEYKLSKNKNLYVFNYRTAGFRSRRMIYLTDRIHHETLTGKGANYWNSTRKNGKMTFFWCDISAIETAKKIVTKYCHQNDCFAYLMVDTQDHNDVNNGFDDLITDVGTDNILNVSDYRDLIKSVSSNRKSASSKGSVSDQDVFLILGDTTNTSKLTIGYNDSAYMLSLTEDRLNDFVAEDEIVYIPILRYKAVSNFPNIANLSNWCNNEVHKTLVKELFDNTNVYAIKQSSIKALEKDGLNLIDFNTFIKRRLKFINNDKFAHLAQYNAIIEKAKKDRNSDDGLDKGYNEGYIDSQFLFHMLNIFGLEYKKYIKNTKIVSAIDSLMIIEFLAETMHQNSFDIGRFKAVDYFGHITQLLSDIGIVGLDSKKIKDTNIMYNSLIGLLSHIYNQTNDNGTVVQDANDYIDLLKKQIGDSVSIPTVKSLREIIKSELDNNPLLKYIIGVSPVSGSLRLLHANTNPLKELDDRGRYSYYGSNKSKWMTNLNDLELFRKQMSIVIG